eukprot:6470734-Prymnesium_polylepis.1
MAACARALRMPVPRVQDIPATLHVVASVRALVPHSPATALSRTYVKRAVHASRTYEIIPSYSGVSQFGDPRPPQLPQDDPQPASSHRSRRRLALGVGGPHCDLAMVLLLNEGELGQTT